MLIIETADLKDTPGAFMQYGGQNILIINENESKEKIGEMILEYTTRQNKRKPALKKALAQ